MRSILIDWLIDLH